LIIALSSQLVYAAGLIDIFQLAYRVHILAKGAGKMRARRFTCEALYFTSVFLMEVYDASSLTAAQRSQGL
jgi:hypothetical protein